MMDPDAMKKSMVDVKLPPQHPVPLSDFDALGTQSKKNWAEQQQQQREI